METLSATVFGKKIPIPSPLLNVIHTGMDEKQQQSIVNKSADERYLLCLIFVLGANSVSFGFVSDMNEKCVLCKER